MEANASFQNTSSCDNKYCVHFAALLCANNDVIFLIYDLIKPSKKDLFRFFIQNVLSVGTIHRKRANTQMCPFRAPRAVQLGCHLPPLHKWRARSRLWLTTWLLRTQMNLKELFFFSLSQRWLLISLASIYRGRISTREGCLWMSDAAA